jgi:hypothetical protein
MARADGQGVSFDQRADQVDFPCSPLSALGTELTSVADTNSNVPMRSEVNLSEPFTREPAGAIEADHTPDRPDKDEAAPQSLLLLAED